MKPQDQNVNDEALHLVVALIEAASKKLLTKKQKGSPFYDSADLKQHFNICDKTLQTLAKIRQNPLSSTW